MEANPNLSLEQIKSILKTTGQGIVDKNGTLEKFTLIDALQVVKGGITSSRKVSRIIKEPKKQKKLS